jgi:hypothetical protein
LKERCTVKEGMRRSRFVVGSIQGREGKGEVEGRKRAAAGT